MIDFFKLAFVIFFPVPSNQCPIKIQEIRSYKLKSLIWFEKGPAE